MVQGHKAMLYGAYRRSDCPKVLPSARRRGERRRPWLGVAMQRLWTLLSGKLPPFLFLLQIPIITFQFRALQPLLAASKSGLGARVIWTSSLEADPTFYDSEDWQLTKTAHSYESSKYQIDIIATHLDRLALEGARNDNVVIRHVVAQPGVAHSEIANALTGAFTNVIKLITFYLVCI